MNYSNSGTNLVNTVLTAYCQPKVASHGVATSCQLLVAKDLSLVFNKSLISVHMYPILPMSDIKTLGELKSCVLFSLSISEHLVRFACILSQPVEHAGANDVLLLAGRLCVCTFVLVTLIVSSCSVISVNTNRS